MDAAASGLQPALAAQSGATAAAFCGKCRVSSREGLRGEAVDGGPRPRKALGGGDAR